MRHRICELRHYTPSLGRGAELLARFRDISIPMMLQYGIAIKQFWREPSTEHIWYIIEWPDLDTRKTSWTRFMKSEDWAEARAKTEQNGSLVERVDVTFLEEPFEFDQHDESN